MWCHGSARDSRRCATAVVRGGASIFGGIGSIRGALAGAIVAATTSNLLGTFITPVLAMLLMSTSGGLQIQASSLLDVAIQHFSDEDGGFYDTADDAAPLIRRPRDAQDNAEPSGWLATANACITQAALTGVVEYRRVAERSLSVVSLLAERGPRAVGWGLAGLASLECGPLEVALVADDPGALGPWWRTAIRGTSPGLVVAASASGEAEVGLLRDRPSVGGAPTAYVCQHFACDAPILDLPAFADRVGVRVLRE